MQRLLFPSVVTLAAFAAAVVHGEDRCTAILVGAQASTTNAPMTTHTNDCAACDFRIGKVPAQTYASDAVHDVVLAEAMYPRYVGSARGDIYVPDNLDERLYHWNESAPIGSIPEVPMTYAYIDGAYGIMNEHQVVIGESTCGARFYAKPISGGGDALFDVAALSRIGLQRAKTAREAIQVMGDLAFQYGFYGAQWEGEGVYSEAGEALTVSDTKEAWMFHVLPDDTGKSAIWAAQRVPDSHISVVANQFVIHEVDLTNTDFFMASPNLHEVATRNNLWSPSHGIPFDFTRVYAHPREDTHQYYSTRRVWRVFTLADPGLNLSPYTDVFASDYPFSIETSRRLTPHDIMRFQRDHYEGTAYDMTKGAPAGPFGNPDRYDQTVRDSVTSQDLSAGHFERAISIFRASYSFVSVANASNADAAFFWFGQYAPHATVYAPVYVNAESTPVQYSNASLFAFDRTSAYWIYALVGNWVARFYSYAHPYVAKEQLRLEREAEDQQLAIAAEASRIRTTDGVQAMQVYLTKQAATFAVTSHRAFSELFEQLVTRFHDGFEVTALASPRLQVTSLFYPKWWLKLVGFFDNTMQPDVPVPPLGEPRRNAGGSGGDQGSASTVSYASTFLIAMISGGIGVLIGRKFLYPPTGQTTGYKPIR